MDLLKLHPNERVDIVDLDFVSETVLKDQQRSLYDIVTGGNHRVLDGFSFAVVAVTTLRVTRGSAIGAENAGGDIRYGQLISEGLASQDVSFSGPTGTYGVWVRFVYADGASANRGFWDPNTDDEYIAAVDTRRAAGWNVLASITSPGAEWFKIASVVWNGANITGLVTDTRRFLFEGPADSSPVFTPDWGGGSDRSSNRAVNGVKTLDRFAQAVLKKIEEIQGASQRWWDLVTEPLDQKVSRNGDLTLTNNYVITNGNMTLAGGHLQISRTDSVSAAPDPATDPWAILWNLSNTVGTVVPLFFFHGSSVGTRDGPVIFSKKTGAAGNQYDLRFGEVTDNTFLVETFIFDFFDNAFKPHFTTGQALGEAGHRWDAFLRDADLSNDLTVAGDAAITGNVVITGDLSVNDITFDGDILQLGGAGSQAIFPGTIHAANNASTAANDYDGASFAKAWGRFSTNGTLLQKHKHNVSSIVADNANRKFVVTLSHPVDPDKSIVLANTCNDNPTGTFNHPAFVSYLWIDSTHLELRLHANFSTAGSIAVLDDIGSGDFRDVSFAVFGVP